MDLQTRKISFIQEFLRIQNEEIITSLENLLKIRKSEVFAQNIKPMSSDQLNSEIDQALGDSENDNLIEATELKLKFIK